MRLPALPVLAPVLLALGLVFSGPGPARAARCTIPAAEAELSRQVLHEVNEIRAAHGLAPLVADPRLTAAARMKACELSRTRRFAHTARDVRTHIRRAGCRFRGPLAENLGHGYLSPQMAAQRWFNSPEHRVNMLHPRVRAAGTAWMPEEAGGGYWVMMYTGSCG